MSQTNQNTIDFLQKFSKTFPLAKAQDRATFDKNVAEIFSNSLDAVAAQYTTANATAIPGDLVIYSDANGVTGCGIALPNQKMRSLGDYALVAMPANIVGVLKTVSLLQTDLALKSPTTSLRNFEEKVGISKKIATSLGIELDAELYFTSLNPAIGLIVNDFQQGLRLISPNNLDALSQIITLVEQKAQELWQTAVQSAQTNNFENPDDRPLYWARLRMGLALKSHGLFKVGTDYTFTNDARNVVIKSGSSLHTVNLLLEKHSRNYEGVNFQTGLKRILVTGFDPFILDESSVILNSKTNTNIKQSNPSGANALALHGRIIKDDMCQDYAQIQVMMFPVRYADFDGNLEINGAMPGTGVVED